MDVSIIIVNYNTKTITDNCIASILEKTSGISFEIILIDNASDDGSREFFQNDDRITYIYNEKNLGFGPANNIAVNVAGGRYILFLNSDTLLKNNAVYILCEYLDKHPDSCACGGNLFLPDGKPALSFSRYFPSIYEEINMLFRNIPNRILFGRNERFNNTGRTMSVSQITAADLMVRRSALQEAGGFNPNFFLYYEDTELCYRLKKCGKLISVPMAEITHLQSTSTKSYFDNVEFRRNLEISRSICLPMIHSRVYVNIMNLVRRITIFTKRISPKRETRITWRS